MILEDGKIIDEGNHKELIERNNIYQTLYKTEIIE
jgi:ABC-type multidrug transport system fused ATPase/permease subunit